MDELEPRLRQMPRPGPSHNLDQKIQALRQGCIKLRLAPPRGADFQSAVSQVSNLRTAEKASEMGISAICRLEVGDTAGWKPALRGAQNSELDAALALREQRMRLELPWMHRRLPLMISLVALAAALLGFMAGYGLGQKPTADHSLALRSPNSAPTTNQVQICFVQFPVVGPFDFSQSERPFFARAVTTILKPQILK